MKKQTNLCLEGAPIELHGRAAQRFWNLVRKPKKASLEERERMKKNYEYFKSISQCNLL
jgi:hypothetical protein